MLNPRRYSKTDYRGLLEAFLASVVSHCILIAVFATTAIYYPPITNSSARFDFNLIWANLGQPDEVPSEPQRADVATPSSAIPREPAEEVAEPAEKSGESSELPVPAPVAYPEEVADAVAVTAIPRGKTKPEPVKIRDVPRERETPPGHVKVVKPKSRPPEQPPEPGLPVPVMVSGGTKQVAAPSESEPVRDAAVTPMAVVRPEPVNQRAENEQRVRLEAERQAALQAEENLRAAEAVRRAELERRARENAAREQRAAEQLARETAARERRAAEQLAREKAAREKAATEQLAREKALREKAAAEQLALEKATRERLAAERLARERVAAEQRAQEKAFRERVAAEKLAREKAAREKLEELARQRSAEEKSRRERAASEQREKEKLALARAAEEKAARLKSELVKPANPTSPSLSRTPARQVAGNAAEAPVPARVSSSAPVKVAIAAVPLGNATAEPKPPPKQEKTAGIALPPIKGDIKLIVHAEDDLSIKVLFIEYPKGKHNRHMTRSEAKALQKLTPVVVKSSKNTLEAVLERAREGIYRFLVEQKGVKQVDGKFSLKLFDAHVKQLAGKKISGETEVARLMMPEGILWEDESAFTGNIEDSDSVTKFNADTGLVWKEYRK